MNGLARLAKWVLRHPQLVLSVIIMLMGILLGVALQNALFMDLLVVLEGVFILMLVTLLLGIFALVFFVAKRSVGKFLKYALVVSVASILSLIFLLGTASLISRWKVDAVEAYVSRAASILDRIKAETHAYPETLPTDLIGEPPSLLSEYGTYTATKDTFCFEYINEPAGWAGGGGFLKFESSNRQWVEDR